MDKKILKGIIVSVTAYGNDKVIYLFAEGDKKLVHVNAKRRND